MFSLSKNTQVILMLTAPLITVGRQTAPGLLKPAEYKKLAGHLMNLKCQPSDFLSDDAESLIRECEILIDADRLKRLLERGFLLSQAVERWRARSIWVVSRADPEYPRKLKSRLRKDAPPVLYGSGEIAFLEGGGLAVVGSRKVDDALIAYTTSIGKNAAKAGVGIVSGGARGIDQAAMRGGIEGGGIVSGILADSLERKVLNRENRNALQSGQL